MKRDKCSRQLAEAKIASQMPQERKQQKSQYIVDNSGSLSHTAEQAKSPCAHSPHTFQLSRWYHCTEFCNLVLHA